MRRALLVLGFGLMTHSSPAYAEGTTVAEFYNYCKKGASHVDGAFCAGYLSGYADSLRVIAVSTELYGAAAYKGGICDADYTPEALRFLFINWAEKNPKRWTEYALVGVDASLRETWPCQ